jgi:hypothetical protein
MTEELTARERDYLEMRIAGHERTEIRKRLGISERQERRYNAKTDPHLRARCDERIAALNRRALDAASEALATLREVMLDKDAAGMVRVNAAGRVLEISLRLHDVADIAQRVANLERLAEQRWSRIA